MKHSIFRRQHGIALIEVGVTLMLMSVSLLAAAMLLTQSARGVRSGQSLARAAALADDIAERMRANRAAVEGTGTNRGFVLTGNYPALSTPADLGSITCGGRLVRAPDIFYQFANNCPDAKSAADFATASWLAQVQTALPGGAGAIIDLGGPSRRIVIAWREAPIARKDTDATDPRCSALAADTTAGLRCLTMEVRP